MMFWGNPGSNPVRPSGKLPKIHGGGVDHKAAILSRAGFQQGNIQRRNPFCHIAYSGGKVNICQKAVEVLHYAIKVCRIHQTSPYSQDVQSKSCFMKHTTYNYKGITPLRAYAVT
jgi:hypothetical protein